MPSVFGRTWIIDNVCHRVLTHIDGVVQGFFEIERGINSLLIEGSDCWYAEPEFDMEEKVLDGALQGSMYGVVDGNHKHSVLVKA